MHIYYPPENNTLSGIYIYYLPELVNIKQIFNASNLYPDTVLEILNSSSRKPKAFCVTWGKNFLSSGRKLTSQQCNRIK